jgi:hypothetical protein
VATEPIRLHLHLDPDTRLAAAAGAAARHLADAGGLKNDAVRQLQTAIVTACQEAFEHMTVYQSHLEVTLTRFTDRIEIALAHTGGTAPAVGLDAIAGFAPKLAENESTRGLFAGIDRVQYETQGGKAVTRLTKYFGHVTPSM